MTDPDISQIIAEIRFIADSTPFSFWGSDSQEEAEIVSIREEYKPWLYDDKPPREIIDKLAPTAHKLVENCNMRGDGSITIDMLVSMYKPSDDWIGDVS